MSSWWDSVDFLTRLNFWIQLGLAVFGVLTALAILSTVFVGKRISDLQNIEAEGARTKQAEAERSLSELQRRVAARGFTAEQRAKFVEVLRPAPRGKVIIFSIQDDRESYSFAQQINESLPAAGFPMGIIQVDIHKAPTGLFILVADLDSPPAHAIALQNAFAAAGYEAPIAPNPRPDPEKDKVIIFVGIKP